jgi:myo-inositol-1(or 4)-monophosphatase
MHDELHAARAAALAAARRIASSGRDIGSVRIKGSQTDMVTDTDIAAGVAAVDAITMFDEHATFVIEEEEVYEATGCRRGELDHGDVWVIDPLDGTTSFVHGYPSYSVSVALLRDGTPIAGAVYNVPAAEMLSAAYGLGATADGVDVRCTQAARLSDALLITGFPYDRGAPLDRQLAILGRFLRAPVHGIRRDGSAALDCCHVAAGRADGFWEFGLKPWDMAAGVVILREAGARVTGVDGETWSVGSTGIVAANPALHERMLHIVLNTDAGERSA